MTNNDIFRRLRFIENINEAELQKIIEIHDKQVDLPQISQWLERDDSETYEFMKDKDLSNFLNGLITTKRGQKQGDTPVIEDNLTNNIRLKKISIAYSLRSEDVIEVLKLVNFRLGKSELSAFFRRPDHKNYRECKDQVLRNFLNGLQKKICK